MVSLRSFAFGLFTLGLATVSATTAADAPAPLPKGQRVFVAGHSFHMPLVVPFDQIAKSAGIEGNKIVGRQSIGGSSVTKHWEKADAENAAKKALKTGEIDVLTLSPFLTPLPDPAVEKFTALLLEHNPKGRVTIQMSWFPFDGPANLGKSFTNAQRDDADPSTFRKEWAPLGEKFRENAKAVNEAFAGKFQRQVLFLVPVGDAVIRLRERVAKGEVPGIAKQSALFTDPLGHGKAAIGVLTAYCHYAVIYGRSPVGLPVPDTLKSANLTGNAEKVNRILQECAWDAVLNEPGSGVKR